MGGAGDGTCLGMAHCLGDIPHPSVSTNPGVPNKGVLLASALLKFLMHVVAFSRASSTTLLKLLELDLESHGGLEKCRPSMTSPIASRIFLMPVISILLLFPQLKFIMAMQLSRACYSHGIVNHQSWYGGAIVLEHWGRDHHHHWLAGIRLERGRGSMLHKP